MKKEKYVHPIYGICERSVVPQTKGNEKNSPTIWIPKPIHKATLDIESGQQTVTGKYERWKNRKRR